jgi:hypothetical protein
MAEAPIFVGVDCYAIVRAKRNTPSGKRSRLLCPGFLSFLKCGDISRRKFRQALPAIRRALLAWLHSQ